MYLFCSMENGRKSDNTGLSLYNGQYKVSPLCACMHFHENVSRLGCKSNAKAVPLELVVAGETLNPDDTQAGRTPIQLPHHTQIFLVVVEIKHCQDLDTLNKW